MRSLSIRIRLTIWYAAVVAVTMALFSCGVYVASAWGVRHVADQELNAGINGINAFLFHKLDIKDMNNLGEELREHASLLPRNRMFRTEDSNGKVLYQPNGMAIIPAIRPEDDETITRNLKIGGRSYRSMSRYVHVGTYLFMQQVAVDQTEYYELLDGLAWLLILSTPFAGLLAAVTGYWMSGRVLRPIQDITKTASTIDANNLQRQLKITGTGDELDRLSETINRMLNRIATSYERIKQFTADASHELRTPTAVVKGSAEVLLMDDSLSEATHEMLSNIVAESDYMTRVIEDLLTLARASAKENLQPMEMFELGESILALKSRITSLAAAKKVAAKVNVGEDFLTLKGNQNVVERVLMILIDNAIRYTPSGGVIEVRTWDGGNEGGFEVVDNGIGIAPEHQGKVFERFYRVDTVRTHGDGGSGLGLSIAKSLIEAYGGTIVLHSELGKGACFSVAFPCARIADDNMRQSKDRLNEN